VRLRRSGFAGLLGALLLVALAVAAPQAQERIRLLGMVQWVGSTTMQVMTAGGTSVAVDLGQADQSSYQAVRAGERIVVDGVVSTDRRRIIAREIYRDQGTTEAP
jgi:hypothetical protein